MIIVGKENIIRVVNSKAVDHQNTETKVNLKDILIDKKSVKKLNNYLNFLPQFRTDILKRFVGTPHLYRHYLKWYERIKEISTNIHENILPNINSIKETLLTRITASTLSSAEKKQYEENINSLASDLEYKLIPIPSRLATMKDVLERTKKDADPSWWEPPIQSFDFWLVRSPSEWEDLKKFNNAYRDITSAINSYYQFTTMIDHITKIPIVD